MRNISNAPFQSFWDSFPSQFHFFDEVTERGKRRNIRRLFGAPPSLRLLCAGENQRRGRKEPPALQRKEEREREQRLVFAGAAAIPGQSPPFPFLSFPFRLVCSLSLPSSPDSMDRISIKQSLNTILLPSLPPSTLFFWQYMVSRAGSGVRDGETGEEERGINATFFTDTQCFNGTHNQNTSLVILEVRLDGGKATN